MRRASNKSIPRLSSNVISEFWNLVAQSDEIACWRWMGSADRRGYGHIRIDSTDYKAHRVAYCIFYGVDPLTYLVCHTCDNPRCCNPKHLFLGTPADNSADMVRKGRHARKGPNNPARGERNGMYTHPESRLWGDKNPMRMNPALRHWGDSNWTRQHPEKVLRGSSNGNSKLDEQAVLAIRNMYSRYNRTGWTIEKLAQHFNVSKSAIGYIVKGETWHHIKG